MVLQGVMRLLQQKRPLFYGTAGSNEIITTEKASILWYCGE